MRPDLYTNLLYGLAKPKRNKGERERELVENQLNIYPNEPCMQYNKATTKNMPDLFAYFGFNDFEVGAMDFLLTVLVLFIFFGFFRFFFCE